MFEAIVRFIRDLFRRDLALGTVADSPQMELEKERRRGVRGD